MIAKQRIYLTEDRSKAVFEGDPKAAFLLVPVGGELKDSEAKRLGLLPEKEIEPPTELPPPARETRVIRQSNKR